jgi:hypothetical protein
MPLHAEVWYFDAYAPIPPSFDKGGLEGILKANWYKPLQKGRLHTAEM